MKKIILILMFSLIVFGADGADETDEVKNKNNESQNIIKSASEGREVIVESDNNNIIEEQKKETNKQLYRNEVILNWQMSFDKMNPRGTEVVGKTAENLLVKNLTEEEGAAQDAAASAEKTTAVKGFCFIPEDVNVGKQPSSLRIECQTNVGAITLFGNLVNVDDKASLVLDPKYIEKSGYRFEVVSSIVTNEEKTSYNIATFVNDRKLSEIGLTAVSSSADVVKNYTNQYLKELQDYHKQEELNITSLGSGTAVATTTTNTIKPDPLDYLALGAVEIGAAVIKNTAEIFKKDLPYLYQIVGKTKIWVDLVVKQEGEYVK